jgi:hypothetical protein
MKRDEVKKLRAEELALNAEEKSERYAAQKRNREMQGWNAFLKRHTGTGAVNRNNGEDVYPVLEANANILTRWLTANNEQIDPEGNALERAFASCRNRLVKYEPVTDKNYERFTDSLESHIAPQHIGSILKFPDPTPPYSKRQIVEMGETEKGRKQLQNAIKYYGADALNKILAGESAEKS